MRHKSVLPIFVFLILLLLVPIQGWAGGTVNLFDATATVQRDGAVTVEERIEVTVPEGEAEWIVRSFITGRMDSSGTVHDTDFRLLSVRRDGEVLVSRVDRSGRRVSVALEGEGVSLSPGRHVYEVAYETKGWVAFENDGYDFILWDVTGGGWTVPIDRAVCRVILPDGQGLLRAIPYTGKRGERGQDAEELSDGTVVTTRALASEERFSLFAAWEKGIVRPGETGASIVDQRAQAVQEAREAERKKREEPPAAPREEVIHLFDVTATVESDGFVTVRERIELTALGREIQRGIIRVFPTDYRGSDGTVARTGFELLSATLDGETVRSEVERVGRDLEIRLGRADRLLETGRHVYLITYRTKGWIAFRKDFDELYWNVTGNDWVFPIERAVYRVVLPEGGAVTKWEAFTGARGDTGKDFVQASDGSFGTTRTLRPGEGLTVAAAWDKGLVSPPSVSSTERLRGWVSGNRGPVVAFLTALVLLYYSAVWLLKGRDPSGGTIIPLFEPPKGIEPGYVRFFKDMEYSPEVLAADILHLAVKGALRFEGSGRDLTIHATNRPRDAMGFTEPQQSLCNSLTNWSQDGGMNLRHETSGRRLYNASTALEESYAAKGEGHFSQNRGWALGGLLLFIPMAVMIPWLGSPVADLFDEWAGTITAFLFLFPSVLLGLAIFEGVTVLRGKKRWSTRSDRVQGVARIVLGVLSAAAMVFLFRMDPVLTTGFVSAALIAALFGSVMPAKTRAGADLAAQIDGLAMYIGTAERHRLSMLNPPEETPELFERLLPYAFALGLAKTWADSFSSILERVKYVPAWSDSIDRVYVISNFADRLSGNLAASVASYEPPSAPSSYSGSSGFGGGGSSGGGGGGGGGRGW